MMLKVLSVFIGEQLWIDFQLLRDVQLKGRCSREFGRKQDFSAVSKGDVPCIECRIKVRREKKSIKLIKTLLITGVSPWLDMRCS